MKPTGIKVTKEELDQVVTAHKCSGMWLSNGVPLGNPEQLVADLCNKYKPPEGSGLNIATGEFVLPD